MSPRFVTVALIPAIALMAACQPTPSDAQSEASGFARIAETAVNEIREELATENLEIGKGTDGEPSAEISPAGELFIGSQPVALDSRQQALVLEYRQNLAGVAEAGAEVGLQAAALATTALKEAAYSAVMGGDEASMEARIEAEAETIKDSAVALCELLPALLDSQRRTAAAVPEFVPYANMTEKDFEDCNENARN